LICFPPLIPILPAELICFVVSSIPYRASIMLQVEIAQEVAAAGALEQHDPSKDPQRKPSPRTLVASRSGSPWIMCCGSRRMNQCIFLLGVPSLDTSGIMF
jgi:hypothetical protein